MNKKIKLALGCCGLALCLPNVRASEEALQTTEEDQESVLGQLLRSIASIYLFPFNILETASPHQSHAPSDEPHCNDASNF